MQIYKSVIALYIYHMNRKHFLSVVAGLPFVPSLSAQTTILKDQDVILPPTLKYGDTIGIVAAAGYISKEDVQPAVREITKWGFRVKLGSSIGKKYFNFGGNDTERLSDFQQMLDDKSVQSIMVARGGYGIVRIIDNIDFAKFKQHPKWIIGFSDVTVLHAHLHTCYGIVSVHSKMCNSFPKDWSTADEIQKNTILSIRDALTGSTINYPIVPNAYNRTGQTEGVLVGGNLKLLENLSGTNSDLYTNGKILFIEDTGEYLYSIDRMLYNLKRSGKLVGLKGLIIGGFKVKPDDPGEEFGMNLYEIVMDKIKDYNYPVCFDFPVGHQKNNFALKCGVKHRLYVSEKVCKLEEIIES